MMRCGKGGWLSNMSTRTPTETPAETRGRRSPSITHVAAAVDPYPEARDAARLAATLAQAAGADLMLVSVEPDLRLLVPGFDWKQMRKETQALLRITRDAVAPQARLKIETDLSVPRGLDRFVRNEQRDLVVVGSSRRGPAKTVCIGKRTRQLLGQLRCSLAIAPRGLSEQPGYRLRQIAVGCDAEPESMAALTVAAGLAAASGARLSVQGVVDDRIPLAWGGAWREAMTEAWTEVMASEIEALRRRLEGVASDLQADVTVEVDSGRPADALRKVSEHVDLLVVGSRRWGAMAHVLLGGTGEALAHSARCPLLVVPKPHEDSA